MLRPSVYRDGGRWWVSEMVKCSGICVGVSEWWVPWMRMDVGDVLEMQDDGVKEG